ncbi:MAG: hypothetical protein Q9214_003976, partial [Letrouitia sp. 1 TL-2023]
IISVSPKPGGDRTGSAAANSSEAAGSKGADKAGKSSTKGGVKTKMGVTIRDKSDGRTYFGKVVNVRKAGYGSRVIVNRGTEENPYFESYPGATFGKGVAKEWLEKGTYECMDLPKDVEGQKIKIDARVKVERTTQKLASKTGRTNSQIQYYMCTVGEEKYISTRSALSRAKGVSAAKLKFHDAQLDRQGKQVLAELDECREKNEHPDTGEQLTDTDIEEMPWLSSDAIAMTQEEDSGSKDEDEDIIIVPQRAGLKRNPKPETVSGSSKTNRNSGNSTESEL